MSLRYSFFAVVPDGIIEIPQGSNLSWLTLFYALPKELVEKYPPALSLPRNIYDLLENPDSVKTIEDDMFLLLVWDCFAWSAWQFFQVPNKDGTYKDVPGDWKNYSGDFPLWRLSYEIIKHFRKKFETEMDWSFQRLFLMERGTELPWLTYQQFSNLIGNLTDMIVAEENWQPMINEFWNNRNPDDYSGSSVHKRDFNRSWYHDRNYRHLSIEEIAETGAMIDGEMLFDIPNPEAEFETKVLQKIGIEQFENRLTEQDKQILRMRMEGSSLKDIAAAVGFKTPSAVSKHIEKIAGAYEDYVSGEYGSFLDKHTKEQIAQDSSHEKRGCFFDARKEDFMSREPFETMPDVMDAKQLAKALQISKAGAYNLLNDPDFPTLRIGGRKMVMKNELIIWLKDHTNRKA